MLIGTELGNYGREIGLSIVELIKLLYQIDNSVLLAFAIFIQIVWWNFMMDYCHSFRRDLYIIFALQYKQHLLIYYGG